MTRNITSSLAWLKYVLLIEHVSFSFLQSDKFSHNASLLDSGLVQQTAAMLANATLHTEKFYGSDVKVAYRLAQNLLQHESNQQGFNLTATQDVHFTEVNNHMLSIMETLKDTVTDIQNTAWHKIKTVCFSSCSKQNWCINRKASSPITGLHVESAGNKSHFISISAVASCHTELSLFSDRIWSVWAAPSCLQTLGLSGSWSSTQRAAQRRCCATMRNMQTHWHRTWGKHIWAPSQLSHQT